VLAGTKSQFFLDPSSVVVFIFAKNLCRLKPVGFLSYRAKNLRICDSNRSSTVIF
jgi:hypothetical protein